MKHSFTLKPKAIPFSVRTIILYFSVSLKVDHLIRKINKAKSNSKLIDLLKKKTLT